MVVIPSRPSTHERAVIAGVFEMSERMPNIVDTKLQAELVRAGLELSEKKRKLEDDIKIADARSKLLLESDALKDIEAYKTRFLPEA